MLALTVSLQKSARQRWGTLGSCSLFCVGHADESALREGNIEKRGGGGECESDAEQMEHEEWRHRPEEVDWRERGEEAAEFDAESAVVEPDGREQIEARGDGKHGGEQDGGLEQGRGAGRCYGGGNDLTNAVKLVQRGQIKNQVHDLDEREKESRGAARRGRELVERFRGECVGVRLSCLRDLNGSGADCFHVGYETVSTFGNSFNELRVGSGVAEDFADLVDGGIERVVEVNEGVGGPECGAQFFAANQFSGALQEEGEDLKRLFLQSQFHAAFAQLELAQVGFEWAEAECGRDLRGWQGEILTSGVNSYRRGREGRRGNGKQEQNQDLEPQRTQRGTKDHKENRCKSQNGNGSYRAISIERHAYC
ncbi:MAG: hypothetical protein JWO20_2640 [Candidatus Angelobacter sp.]|jgi:hypothetical protein|nr:hypothetical protein [Candidatus Angelobacter sp.]